MARKIGIIYHKLDLGQYMLVELDCICAPSSNVLFPADLCTWKKELCNMTWRYINSLSQNFVRAAPLMDASSREERASAYARKALQLVSEGKGEVRQISLCNFEITS